MAKFPYSITPGVLTIVVGNRVRTVHSSSPNFEQIKAHLKTTEHDLTFLEDLLDLRQFVAKATFGRVQISDDMVLVAGKQVNSVVADRILDLMRAGDDVEPMSNFLDRLTNNPLESAKAELLLWLEAGAMPITPDGCFLAFKAVRANFTDKHTGTFNNSVGVVVSMDRDVVDPDRNKECSRGLHFCSPGYLPNFASVGDPIMIVKIDPADVVAIPRDYNNQKGRTWRYEVVGQVPVDEVADTFFGGRPLVRNEYQGAVVGWNVEASDDYTPDFNNEPTSVWDDTSEELEEDYGEQGDENIYVALHSGFAGVADTTDQLNNIISDIPFMPVDDKPYVFERDVAASATVEKSFTTNTGATYSEDEIKAALKATDGSVRGAARELGVAKSTLQAWVKRITF